MQITVNLSQQSYEQLKEVAEYQNLSIEQALEKAAENISKILDGSFALEMLSDQIILQMANAKMDEEEDDSLDELQHVDSPLTEQEAVELAQLKAKAYRGQLIKNEAMLEAEKRGLL